MINKEHITRLIEKTLFEYDLYTKDAFDLVYGTIIQESRRGKYRRQMVKVWDYNKHAIGISQVEKGTFDWLTTSYLGKYP